MSADSLFSTLSEIENLSESDTKEMVESIIAILKGRNITYSQAFKILDVTHTTLSEMSRLLVL